MSISSRQVLGRVLIGGRKPFTVTDGNARPSELVTEVLQTTLLSAERMRAQLAVLTVIDCDDLLLFPNCEFDQLIDVRHEYSLWIFHILPASGSWEDRYSGRMAAPV